MAKGSSPSNKQAGKHWFPDFVNALTEQGMEVLGLYYSFYPAFVYDNEDPEFLGRVLVSIPDLTGDQVHPRWAWPRSMFSGKTQEGVVYGQQSIPEKGDLVMVSFPKGDVNCPYWEFGWRSKDEVPSEELRDVNTHWFITPAGHKVVINDTKKSINITHANGQSVEIDDEAISFISEKKISLGTQHKSKEPAVLGDKNGDVLEGLRSILSNLSEAITKDIAASGTAGVPYLMFSNLATAVPQMVLDLAQLQNKIPETKSTIVTLD